MDGLPLPVWLFAGPATLEELTVEQLIRLAAGLAVKLSREKQRGLPEALRAELGRQVALVEGPACEEEPGQYVVLWETPGGKLKAQGFDHEPSQCDLEGTLDRDYGASVWIIRRPEAE